MQSEITALWESYYVTKPLTFWEFVKKQTNLKQLFICVEDALKTYEKVFEENPFRTSEVYVSGATGIGKGIYCYLIMAYRLYLATLLKNPKEGIFQIVSSCELSCMFVGACCDEKLTGFFNFLKGIQNPEDPIFVFEESRDAIAICKNENRRYFARFRENEIVFRTAKSAADIVGTNPLIVDYEADFYETVAAMKLLEQIQNRMKASFGTLKNLLSCLLVEKSPNNLYNDLIDQHIRGVESIYLVERFVPIYMRNTRQQPENTYFIDLLNDGVVGPIEKLENYITKNPKNDIRQFPTEKGSMNLLDLAIRNPKEFVNDILGEPTTRPYKKSLQNLDMLSNLQTVRELINAFQIQFVFSGNSSYLTIPGTDLKVKLWN